MARRPLRQTVVVLLATLLIGSLMPSAVGAQAPTRTYRVGVLWHAASREGEGHIFDALVAGLREHGLHEGRNIAFEHRFPDEKSERFRGMAAELVALKPDLLVAVSPHSAVALKNTGTSIPIVFTSVGDAVSTGLVRSLARPGGTITGFTILSADLTNKRLQLLREIFPTLKRVGVVCNPDNPVTPRFLQEVAAGTTALGLEAELAGTRNGADIEAAFARFGKSGIRAAFVCPDAMLFVERGRIARAAIAGGIAETQFSAERAEAGSLFSYGTDLPAVLRQTGDYVARILWGARPGDLPVVEPTRFELVINMKTAKALRITMPPALLLRADHLID